MWRLLRFIFLGDAHNHKWETYKETRVATRNGGQYIRVYLKCAHCGELKVFEAD